MTDARRLFPVERRRQIAKLADESGVLRIGELASRFQVADETIRRDLVWLEQQGVLTREHGGALSAGSDRESLYNSREREHSREKRLIAQVAVDFVRDSSTIILDSGTTTHHLVPLLRSKRDLVVITNGISHVAGLLANPTTSVVVAGGSVRRESVGTVGDLAVATLEKLHADHTFLATHGFSAQMGITYPNLEEVAVKQRHDSRRFGGDSLGGRLEVRQGVNGTGCFTCRSGPGYHQWSHSRGGNREDEGAGARGNCRRRGHRDRAEAEEDRPMSLGGRK